MGEGGKIAKEKAGRGPMSEEARVMQARRKFRELGMGGPTDPSANNVALAALKEYGPHPPGHVVMALSAKDYEDVASFLRIVEKLSDSGRADLLKLVS